MNLLINQLSSAAQIIAARELMGEYFSWFFALVPGAEQDPAFRGWEGELVTLPGACIPPMGRFLLATLDGQPAGCIALKPVDKTKGELKRLYVRPIFRGHRVGVELVKAFLDEARACGYRSAVLDSHRSMTKAHEIYQGLGFKMVDAPVDFPAELKPNVKFMQRDL